MMKHHSDNTRKIALLMSCLLFFASLLSFAAGDRHAGAAPAPYVPLPEVTPGYTGSLIWMDYSAPRPQIGIPGPEHQHTPYFLAIDDSDNMYVSKISAVHGLPARIDMISNNSQTVTNVTYDGNFTYPTGIAVDKDGNIYVTDNTHSAGSIETNASRIMKLPYGENEWDDITHGETFIYAHGVAVDHQGNVYTIDRGLDQDHTGNTKRIMKLPSGSQQWGNTTENQSVLSNPVDIAVDGEGNVFVSQGPSGNGLFNVLKLPAGETAWTDITPANSAPGFFYYGITVDQFDNVFVLSLLDATVMKLGYGGGSGDWTEVGILSNLSSPASNIDIAVDSRGYLYSTNIVRGNLNKLMASVIYNGNSQSSGTAPVDNVGYEAGVTAYVYGNTGNLTKTGYTFDGWNTDAHGTGTPYSPGDAINITGSVTLYAAWTPIPSYMVTYQAAAGGSISGPGSETVYEGGSPAAVPTATPDADYTFLGWSSDGGSTLLTGDQLASTVVTGVITYTAYFQPPVALTGVALDSAGYRLKARATHQTVVTAVYSDNSELTISSGVSFSSSNSRVAAVDSTGLVTAKASGRAVITAEYGGFQAQANVHVPAEDNVEQVVGPAEAIEATPTPEAAAPAVEVILDGVIQEQLATANQETVNGQIVTAIVLDSQKVINKLKSDNSKLLTIPVTGKRQSVIGQLTGSLVKALEQNEAVVQIVTEQATYTLPTAQIRIDGIAGQLGSGIRLEDIIVNIEISEASDDTTAQAEEAAQRYDAELVVRPVSFTITATYGSRTVAANQFNSYVERTIALPEDIDPGKITTGVVLADDGDLFHVPTVVVEQDGIMYARMYSLTNSAYSVIYNPREMNDLIGHWAKNEANDMSSRLIVPSVTATEFRPDAPVSRAEFAAIVARALGIQDASYAGGFSDVEAADSFAGAVQAAINYKLIGGYGDGTFRPDRLISRQEAAVIIAKAMDVAKLTTAVSAADAERLLAAFADGGETASWARNSVAAAISLNIISGRGEQLDLNAHVTRAETSALVRRLLQAAELINQ